MVELIRIDLVIYKQITGEKDSINKFEWQVSGDWWRQFADLYVLPVDDLFRAAINENNHWQIEQFGISLVNWFVFFSIVWIVLFMLCHSFIQWVSQSVSLAVIMMIGWLAIIDWLINWVIDWLSTNQNRNQSAMVHHYHHHHHRCPRCAKNVSTTTSGAKSKRTKMTRLNEGESKREKRLCSPEPVSLTLSSSIRPVEEWDDVVE